MSHRRTTRVRLALIATFPTVLTVPLLALLAAFGEVPGEVLPALPVALAVHAVVTYLRLGRAVTR
ncbi:hypothetical protein [Streptomyces sp. UNOB3_S3]|uniref:hypothetical protein n=1 Tax=Streptomyces sp. UNOB3_S3 TaxID=2871682 RepID=UPI001E482DBA|nr:hypothetical protein [Streptomyces sp. UNOB3_S3]MCC3777698.1 hypothetical protein [Streptomyces sp. UNOB3_S3]